MKSKTLTIAGILLGIIALNVFFLKTLTEVEKKVQKNAQYKTIKIEDITLKIPYGLTPQKTKTVKVWKVYPFKSEKIFFRVSVARGNADALGKIVKIDLKLKKLPEKEGFILTKLCYVKKLPFPEKGYYYIKHKNKTNHYVLLIENKGKIYYIDMLVPSTLKINKNMFDTIILSIKDGERKLLGKTTEKELKTVCAKTYFILCQSEKQLILGISSLVGISILLIFLLVTRKMGKLPEDLTAKGIIPIYSEEDVSTSMVAGTKIQKIYTAILVESRGIHIFYKQKRLIFIENQKAKEALKEEKFLFSKGIELVVNKNQIENPPFSIKWSVYQTIKFRFFPKERERIMQIIKNL